MVRQRAVYRFIFRTMYVYTVMVIIFYFVFADVKGLEETTRIVKMYSHQRLLAALAPVVATVVPCPLDLRRFHEDEFVHPIEKVEALPVLRKMRLGGFGHGTGIPHWIDYAIAVLSMTDDGEFVLTMMRNN